MQPECPEVAGAGPVITALEKVFHDRLVAKLVSEGNSNADATEAVATVAGSHPLLDLLMQYGLPLLLQLLTNLIALKPTPAPAPTPAA